MAKPEQSPQTPPPEGAPTKPTAPEGKGPPTPEEKPTNLGDVARARMQKIDEQEARARKEAARLKARSERQEHELREKELEKVAQRLDELCTSDPKKYSEFRIFLVRPDQPANAVVRGRCFRPGQLFLAHPDEVRALRYVEPL